MAEVPCQAQVPQGFQVPEVPGQCKAFRCGQVLEKEVAGQVHSGDQTSRPGAATVARGLRPSTAKSFRPGPAKHPSNPCALIGPEDWIAEARKVVRPQTQCTPSSGRLEACIKQQP